MSQEEMQHEWRLKRVDLALKTARHLMTCVTVGFGLYLVRGAISDLAGKTTLADIALRLLVSLRARDWFAILCVLFSSAFGVGQWYLRRKEMRHRSDRRVYLEREVDPSRVSSQPTATGDTRPEDR